MKTVFAEMTQTGSLVWKYQSMKVVPGTKLMMSNMVSGNIMRGFAVGKYDVPDMFEFIKSYENIYTDKGIFMKDHTYWARPFYIHVLTPTQWAEERNAKYAACMANTVAWGYDNNKGIAYCEYAEPEANMMNITA